MKSVVTSAKYYVNKHFGRLFVLKVFRKNRESWAKCHCLCDKKLPKEERKVIKVRLRHLANKHSKSCGCLLKIMGKRSGAMIIRGESYSVEYILQKNTI